MGGTRLLSYSEIDAALTCLARHDFAYGGHLAGATLKPKATAAILSEGRAWGAACAAWHANMPGLFAIDLAQVALTEALDRDEARLREHGLIVDHHARIDTELRLRDLLAHYTATTEPLTGLYRLEEEFTVPIPSRHSARPSSRYRLVAKIDGYCVIDGHEWLVEFKLRRRLHEVALMERAAQYRFYSWALREARDVHPIGIIIDERLNEVPRPPRLVKAKRKSEGIEGRTISHSADQLITADDYLAACRAFDVEPNPETLERARTRMWQHRHPLMFRNGELDEAAQQLVGAARLIRDLDNGAIHPIRNAKPSTCGGCQFARICAHPRDDLYVDTLFERTVPKRLRPPIEPQEGTP